MSGDLRLEILKLINHELRGIELGPSYNPVAAKKNGYNILTVDHAPASALREKYSVQKHIDTDRIEDVDIIWNGGALDEQFPADQIGQFHYIIACHFIEHMVDLIGFLKSVELLLANDGLLILLVPDKRYCFDFCQPLTDLADLIRRHLQPTQTHSFEAYFRHATQIVYADGNHAWGQDTINEYTTTAYPADPIALANGYASANQYIDTHGQYFTPRSMELILEEMRFLRLTQMAPMKITAASGCEFLAVLKKNPASDATMDGFLARRIALQMGVLMDIDEQITQAKNSKTWGDIVTLARSQES